MPIAHLSCLLAGIDRTGRPRKRLKTDRFDDRKCTTIPVTANGRTSYPKIHVRTKDEDAARRRLTALDYIDEPAEARRRIDRLASATSEAHERAMLSDFVLPPMYCHSVAIDDARQELGDVLDGFMDRRTLKTIACDAVSSVSDIGSLSFLRFLERP
ncbi:MAG: hypothetical protein V1790_01975 [Planctomycetota bacterium]